MSHGIVKGGNGGIQLTGGCTSLGVSMCSASCLGAVRLRGNYSLQADAAKIDSADQINVSTDNSPILPMIQPISYVCFWYFFCQNTDIRNEVE